MLIDTGGAREDTPHYPVQWFRPYLSNAHLDLLSTPIVTSKLDSNRWVALTEEESDACECKWQLLTEDEKFMHSGERGSGLEAETQNKGIPNEDANDRSVFASIHDVGIAIGKDKLFEVVVKNMQLIPTYWKYTGPPLRMRRALWLYNETQPVEESLEKQLEKAYDVIQPWRSNFSEELDAARSLGAEGYEKLKYSVSLSSETLDIFFEDEFTARLISPASTSVFYDSLMTHFRRKSSEHPIPSGRYAYRGLNRASLATAHPKSPTPPIEDQEPPMIEERKTRDGTMQSLGVGGEGGQEITDLILVVHGIGQGMTTSWEAFNFLYATNQLRQIAEKQAAHPAISSVMRNRRVQFLPVLWRANLKLAEHDEMAKLERAENGFTNSYTLEDITLNNKIPFVRDVMNNVLIDVPYFMSHHRQRMIEAVVQQSNHIYRLWCARNAGFACRGKVHLIAHSLGSALAAHILSDQPTQTPNISSLSESEIVANAGRFLFNTSSLFMVGSPLGVFLHLQQAQLIARQGRERTEMSPSDEAVARVGLFGCLSVDSVYNIFHASDPIACALWFYVPVYCQSERVYSHGAILLPSAIPSINESVLSSLSMRMTKLLGVPFSSSPPRTGKSAVHSRSPSRPSSTSRMTSEFELGSSTERKPGSLAERRFYALNPHSTVDFYLPAKGNISDYVDMLSAHSSYWSDANFASFVISEICARREDLMRTGLGPLQSDSKSYARILKVAESNTF